jgi:cytoskeletal protein CcmA (bactofilin family)
MIFKKRNAVDEVLSCLGEGVEMTGEIIFTQGLRVDGVVKGKVRSEAVLLIGREGKIDADVSVRRILISGEFRGVIRASERVEILREGKVYGDIYSPCLIIEAGAIFEGRCNMSEKKILKPDGGNLLKTVDSESQKQRAARL